LILVRSGGGLSVVTGPAAVGNQRMAFGVVAAAADAGFNTRFFKNGVVSTAASNGNTVTGSGANIRVGRRADGAVQLVGEVYYLYIWNQRVPDSQMMGLSANPGLLIRPGHVHTPGTTAIRLRGNLPVSWSGFVQKKSLLPVEWRGLVLRRLRNSMPVSWGGTARLRGILPVSWSNPLARKSTLPVEWKASLRRKSNLPVSWSSVTRLRALLPVAWGGPLKRLIVIPVEWSGLDPNLISHLWNVLNQLTDPLLHSFVVLNFRQEYDLVHTWNVKRPSEELPHAWFVTKDIATPFGFDTTTGLFLPVPAGQVTPGDIQCPVAVKDKTP
jgi:hypothetical protein